jgi:hypothetical protein
MTFQTNPPKADVWVVEYGATDDEWLPLGKTPFTSRELPFGYYSVRIVKPGFEPILGAAEVPGPPVEFDLDPMRTLPPDMVRVSGGNVSISGIDEVRLGPFLIDRYEISNRQFKQFLDSGGYGNYDDGISTSRLFPARPRTRRCASSVFMKHDGLTCGASEAHPGRTLRKNVCDRSIR